MAVIPNTNVSIATIRDVLNGAGGSVGNDVSTFFTTSANINMWSRYKPVIYNKTFGMTDDDYKAASFGLSIASRTNQGVINWAYTLPTGGESSPFRLEDFRNYDTSATGFAWEQSSYTYDLDTQSGGIDFTVASSTTRITPLDFKDTLFAGCYLQFYANHGSYAYTTDWTLISNVTSQTWNLPASAISNMGTTSSGTYAKVLLRLKFSDGLVYNLCSANLTIKSSSADLIYFDALKQGTSSTNGYTSDYTSGVTLNTMEYGGGYNTINFNNSSYFYFTSTLWNNSTITLSQDNMMALLTYTDTNSNTQTVHCPIYNGKGSSWSLAAGKQWGGFSAGIMATDVPTLWSSATVRPVGFVIQVNMNGTWVDVTQRLTLRMIKS